MEIILKKRPKNPIMVHGFPGVGLVGTITTEFLLDHLDCEQIGKINIEEMSAAVAIHDNKLVDPFGIFYNRKYNMVIVHAITATQGLEWKIANFVFEIAKKLQAKEIVSVEGVGGNAEESNLYFFTKDKKKAEKIKKLKIQPLKEGIVMGVTGALLLKGESMPITCFFSETHTQLPDSKAAAKAIEGLDKYLGLKVDYKPLLEQAQDFEAKLQGIMKKGMEAQDLVEKKRMSYVG